MAGQLFIKSPLAVRTRRRNKSRLTFRCFGLCGVLLPLDSFLALRLSAPTSSAVALDARPVPYPADRLAALIRACLFLFDPAHFRPRERRPAKISFQRLQQLLLRRGLLRLQTFFREKYSASVSAAETANPRLRIDGFGSSGAMIISGSSASQFTGTSSELRSSAVCSVWVKVPPLGNIQSRSSAAGRCSLMETGPSPRTAAIAASSPFCGQRGALLFFHTHR